MLKLPIVWRGPNHAFQGLFCGGHDPVAPPPPSSLDLPMPPPWCRAPIVKPRHVARRHKTTQLPCQSKRSVTVTGTVTVRNVGHVCGSTTALSRNRNSVISTLRTTCRLQLREQIQPVHAAPGKRHCTANPLTTPGGFCRTRRILPVAVGNRRLNLAVRWCRPPLNDSQSAPRLIPERFRDGSGAGPVATSALALGYSGQLFWSGF